METITYEEDLHTNPLYIRLIDKYSLLEEISVNNWIVALPKRSSFLTKYLNNHEFMLSHILTPSEELPKSHFFNLLGDYFLINGNEILNKSEPVSAKILFEEYFYTKDRQRYKIICLDRPLSEKYLNIVATMYNNDSVVKSVEESLELIRHKCSKKPIEKKIDNAIKNFNSRVQNVTDYESLQKNIKLLYDYCANLTNYQKLKDEPFLSLNLKIAVEYILMESIYEKIFDAIIIKHADENEKFNKILRNINQMSLSDLNISTNISCKIQDNLNITRIELLKIDDSKTSLDKLSCLKNLIDLISNLIGNMTTDLLLPVMVHMVIKSNYFLWIPTLIFIKEFNLSSVLNIENQSSGSALLYILTTLEAIIYFIQTNENISIENNNMFQSIKFEDIACEEDYILYKFELIKENNESQFKKLLNITYANFKNDNSLELLENSKCHPLCLCQKCEIIDLNRNKPAVCDTNLKSQNKLTMLHIASIYNIPKIVTMLINEGADVNSKDSRGWTSLHYASRKGHQKVLFLLLHNQNNSINLRTNHQQTALMLSSMYGHEQCVKALLFFAEHTHTTIDVNAQDLEGMTALHYSVQSGFDGIVENLLEYQSKVTTKNRLGKMPVEYARNSMIKKKLDDAAKYQVEELPIAENEFIFIRKEDLEEIFQEI